MGSQEDTLVVISKPNDGTNDQTLRVVVTLSAITSRPVKIEDIRSHKKNRGMTHLGLLVRSSIPLNKAFANFPTGMTASLVAIVNWLAQVTSAEVEGNEPQSQTLMFRPKQRPSYKLIKKEIKVDSGSMAASSIAFLQTMLPVLLWVGGDPKSEKPIEVRIDGATNCLSAPSYEYLDQIFLPALETYFGIKTACQLTRRGWGQMTMDARVIQKGTIRVKIMPLEWDTTLKLRGDAGLCDEDEESAENLKEVPWPDAHYGVGGRVDNNILTVVATIVTPTAMHDPLQEAITEDIESRFPGAEIEFKTEESGHTDRVYVMLVAKAKYCRWGRDYINSERLKDAHIPSLCKQISSQLAKDLEGESNSDCPIDIFLQDQMIIYQSLAEGRSSFPRPSPPTEDSLDSKAQRNDLVNDSWQTQSARHAAAMVLSDAKFSSDGKVCVGAGVKAGPANKGGRGRK